MSVGPLEELANGVAISGATFKAGKRFLSEWTCGRRYDRRASEIGKSRGMDVRTE